MKEERKERQMIEMKERKGYIEKGEEEEEDADGRKKERC